MSKHTPGPWEFAHHQCSDGMYRTQVFSCEHGTVADCAWTPKPCVNGVMKTYREANACLIAAAPDLLAALQDLFGAELEKCMAYDGHDDQMQAVAKARAAIAKATGEGA